MLASSKAEPGCTAPAIIQHIIPKKNYSRRPSVYENSLVNTFSSDTYPFETDSLKLFRAILLFIGKA